jgi:hypothetical protein
MLFDNLFNFSLERRTTMSEQAEFKVIVDEKKGVVKIILPIENRLSGSEKSIIIGGIRGSKRIKVGNDVCVVAGSLYKKNPNYDAAEVAKRLAAEKDAPKEMQEAKIVA